VETLIGWFTPTPEQHAQTIIPLLVAPDLERHGGAFFNQGGDAIAPSPQLADRT
jgi:hypothetical protein